MTSKRNLNRTHNAQFSFVVFFSFCPDRIFNSNDECALWRVGYFIDINAFKMWHIHKIIETNNWTNKHRSDRSVKKTIQYWLMHQFVNLFNYQKKNSSKKTYVRSARAELIKTEPNLRPLKIPLRSHHRKILPCHKTML